MGPLRIGVIGFGHIGMYIIQRLMDPSHPDYISPCVAALSFVWNRTSAKLRDESFVRSKINAVFSEEQVLENLDDMEARFPQVDLIIEVAHPSLYLSHGERWLRHASVFVGSPTAFAQGDIYDRMRGVANDRLREHQTCLYFPAGALWGATDILKMGETNALASVWISMRKPPHSMRLEEPLQSKLDAFVTALGGGGEEECVLYEGPVRDLCPMAPSNVNTMACLAIASGAEIGFDGCIGQLVADNRIEAHIIEIRVKGKPQKNRNGDAFEVSTRRYNPCDPNQVTASATYPSFFNSLKKIISESPSNGGVRFV